MIDAHQLCHFIGGSKIWSKFVKKGKVFISGRFALGHQDVGPDILECAEIKADLENQQVGRGESQGSTSCRLNE